MKIVKNIFSAFFLTLVNGVIVFAANPSAMPTPTLDDDDPTRPDPPGGAIDHGIVILVVIALLLGIYVIYKYNLKRKASM